MVSRVSLDIRSNTQVVEKHVHLNLIEACTVMSCKTNVYLEEILSFWWDPWDCSEAQWCCGLNANVSMLICSLYFILTGFMNVWTTFHGSPSNIQTKSITKVRGIQDISLRIEMVDRVRHPQPRDTKSNQSALYQSESTLIFLLTHQHILQFKYRTSTADNSGINGS